MKAKTGFLQELQADGSIADSLIRALSVASFVFLCVYTIGSFVAYYLQFHEYVILRRDDCISEQSFITLILQLKKIDWNIFLILMVGAFAPKVIQKFAETKLGSKDISETSLTTIKTDKSSTTP
jgi:hypothetical protein